MSSGSDTVDRALEAGLFKRLFVNTLVLAFSLPSMIWSFALLIGYIRHVVRHGGEDQVGPMVLFSLIVLVNSPVMFWVFFRTSWIYTGLHGNAATIVLWHVAGFMIGLPIVAMLSYFWIFWLLGIAVLLVALARNALVLFQRFLNGDLFR